VFFRYSSAADTDWQCIVRANNVDTGSVIDSATAVAAATWTKLRVEVDGTSAVRFFVNGSEVCAGTAVTNLPIGNARGTGLGTSFIRSAGTASRTVDIDYIDAIGTFVTTPR
jgi:hypothetical protein